MSARGVRKPSFHAPEAKADEGVADATLEGDRDLLEAFRRGDRDALTRVFHMYVQDVSLTLRSSIRVEVGGVRTLVGGDLPPWELENLLHETFTRGLAPKARASYDGLRPFGAWLGTIARNLVVDRARRERRENQRVVFVDDLSRAEDTTRRSDPAAAVEDGALRALLAAFVTALDEEDRALFNARYDEGLSLRAAAKALGRKLFPMRKRDTALRLALLSRLREAGFCEGAQITIGSAVLDRRTSERRDGTPNPGRRLSDKDDDDA